MNKNSVPVRKGASMNLISNATRIDLNNETKKSIDV